MRYGLRHVKEGIKNPNLVIQEINRIYHRRMNRWEYNRNGIDIFAEDWDNLIILDACRADAYREHALPNLPDGKFETRKSRASATEEWIRANFTNRTLHDTVYVTGSSWIMKLGDRIGTELHAVVDAKDDFEYDQEFQVEKSLEANEQFPNKRLLVHLIPPHHPYMGPLADEHLPPIEEQGNDFFNDIRNGNVGIESETLWDIYLENLDRVIPAVRTLIKELPGKTVVSADHGELLGDRIYPIPIREWGHMWGMYVDELITVPWHVHNGNRKTITEDPPIQEGIDSRSPEEIEEHLKSLGYKV